jgi:heme/copper-type cytochrome/quinol oxidase subunit 2
VYATALTFHNILRLAVVVICLWAFFRALTGWLGNRPWGHMDRLSTLLLVILVDVQLVLGLLLYFVWSPLTQTAMSDMGSAMNDAPVRKMAVEHPVMMIAAIALVHAARVMAKGSSKDSVRHRRTAICLGVAMVLFVVGTGWPWNLYPRPWLRMDF